MWGKISFGDGVNVFLSPQIYDCGGSSCHPSLCTCVSSHFSIVVISKWRLIESLLMQQVGWGCSRCMLQLSKMSTGHRGPAAYRPRHVWLRRICQKLCCSVLLEYLCSIFFQEILPNSKIAETQSYCTGRGGGSCFLAAIEGKSLTDGRLPCPAISFNSNSVRWCEFYWLCDVTLAQLSCVWL